MKCSNCGKRNEEKGIYSAVRMELSASQMKFGVFENAKMQMVL